MALQIKAFLYEDKVNRPKEIRRFAIDQDVSSSYDYLRRKVATVFPNLGEDNFALQWRDSDGDLIWFNSDEELMQALGQLDGDVFRLFIKQNSGGQTESDTQEPRGPRCGRRRNYPGWCGPGNPWVNHPFSHWGPRFNPPPYHFFQQQHEASQEKQEEKPQEAAQSSSSSEQQQSQHQQTAEGYLKHMGNAVADFLQPFGIDVDINVEHKGQREKCTGTKQPQGGSSDKEKDASKDKSKDSSDEGDWTFLKKDGVKSGTDAKGAGSGEDTMETDEDTVLKDALAQLTDMGFNDHGGWLTNLLKTYNFDIARVLEAMQPAQGSK